MPKVPYSDNVVPMRPAVPPPSQESLMLAAGMMYNEGKFQMAGDVVPLPVKPTGPTFKRGTEGKPIPLTPENVDRTYGGKG